MRSVCALKTWRTLCALAVFQKAVTLLLVHSHTPADYRSCICSGSSHHSSDRWLQSAVRNHSSLWYIVTDCAGLRLQLRNSWGLKVWVPRTELAPIHIDKLQSSGVPLGAADVLRVYTAFAEQWLLAMTDYQVS